MQSVQLQRFADASERAYGAVVYFRVELTDGTVVTELVTSRTRVAPINGDTIPRLELLSSLVLARLINSVLTAFEGTLRVDSVFCWSDSQIALRWIWGVNREFKQFVQNRVVEIRGLVKQLIGITVPGRIILLIYVVAVHWPLSWLPTDCGGMALSFF
ncbi:uncharacterized protein [Montipora capricornis]|uniref:uncharacterized protein n=1 Tax=Montipora capricornis TaxID=246305 RepID=UPI0035F175CB